MSQCKHSFLCYDKYLTTYNDLCEDEGAAVKEKTEETLSWREICSGRSQPLISLLVFIFGRNSREAADRDQGQETTQKSTSYPSQLTLVCIYV